MKVLGGSEQEKTYRTVYEEESADKTTIPYGTSFILAPQTIGIPVLNIVTLPFFFQGKYSEYRDVILQ